MPTLVATILWAIVGGGLCFRIQWNGQSAEQHVTQTCLRRSHSDFVSNFEPDGDCTKGNYPRSCLMSNIPVATPYNQIRSCFSCCMKVWIAKLGLDKNFAYHTKMGHLTDENKYVTFKHTVDEIILTPNSLQKFAHVVFMQSPDDEYRKPVYKNLFNANFTEVDPPLHRPCVEKEGTQCVIPRGGLILWRAFQYSDFAAEHVADWAKHSTFSILIEGDRPQGNEKQWESAGGHLFRTNPMINSLGFVPEANRGFYPLGMDAHASPMEHDKALSGIGQRGTKDELLFCPGMQTDYAPHRKPIIEALLNNGFKCEGEKQGRDAYMLRMSKAKFVVSPQGVGWACYRTWEALAAGAIPIISWYPGVEELYEGLPVLISTNYSEITTSYLEDQWERIRKDQSLSHSKAFLPYWLGTLFAELSPVA